jgi:hypothetical protein
LIFTFFVRKYDFVQHFDHILTEVHIIATHSVAGDTKITNGQNALFIQGQFND